MRKEWTIEKLPEFDNHRLVNFIFDETTGLKGFIAIHRWNRSHPSFGATRLWGYGSEQEALQDALRLSKTMSYKAALAGLPYGGAKGVLMADSLKARRRTALLKAYAERVNYLSGRFITGSDAGLSLRDVKTMRQKSPYIVGLKCNPEKLTAQGVFGAVQVCLKETFGNEAIKDRSFAIQGLGKVGMGLLKPLYREGGEIFVADVDAEKTRTAKRRFPHVKVVKPGNIHRLPVDVFMPCALSGSINQKSVAELDCRIIAGGANNQLESEEVGVTLHQLGVVYAPDYVVNAGGLIGVVDEFENNNASQRRVTKRVGSIKETLRRILERSKKEKRATNLVADEMAKEILRGEFRTS